MSRKMKNTSFSEFENCSSVIFIFIITANLDSNKIFLNNFVIINKKRKEKRRTFWRAKSSTITLMSQCILSKMK